MSLTNQLTKGMTKGKIAGASAAALALIFAAGGYLASYAAFDSFKASVEKSTADLINTYAKLEGDDKVTAALEEGPDSGMFSKNMRFVIANKSESFSVPVKLDINFLNYTFSADPVKGRVNDLNLMRYFDMRRVTAIEVTGKAHLLSKDGSIRIRTSYVNDLDDLKAMTPPERESVKSGDGSATVLGVGETGSALFDLKLEDSGRLEAALHVTNMVEGNSAVGEGSLLSVTENIFEPERLDGSLAVELRNVVYPNRFTSEADRMDKVLLNVVSTDKKKGAFDLGYSLYASNYENSRDIRLSGDIKGFSLSAYSVLGGNFNDMLAYFAKNPLSLTINKGTSWSYVENVPKTPGTNGKDTQRSVRITCDGAIGTVSKDSDLSFEGNILFTADRDPSEFETLSTFVPYMKQNRAAKTFDSKLEFRMPVGVALSKDMRYFRVNGKEVLYGE